jgi:hypothetical protein
MFSEDVYMELIMECNDSVVAYKNLYATTLSLHACKNRVFALQKGKHAKTEFLHSKGEHAKTEFLHFKREHAKTEFCTPGISNPKYGNDFGVFQSLKKT